MAHILAVANQKGGVAKTTSVASIGAALTELGRRVLLVDLDPQACLTFSLGLEPDALELSVHDVLLGRLSAGIVVTTTGDGTDLLPATIELAGCEAVLLSRTGREHALRLALADVVDAYDFVLIDCPPSLGVLTINGLTAADEVIVPLQCETLSHRGVGQLLDTVHDVQRLTNPRLAVRGVLPTLFDARTAHGRAVLADVRVRYGLAVLTPPIARSVRFAEAPGTGRSILATAGRSKGADAYRVHARVIAGMPPGETAGEMAGGVPGPVAARDRGRRARRGSAAGVVSAEISMPAEISVAVTASAGGGVAPAGGVR
ncbi:putative partitioning or sporulation protein [Frankia canadensis]|uniref:Putative partitioning or sporulation protein n=1 Tax=Frankia canadensis TaxID=1836972 RepID=A0A2I2KJP7_9ACTN|nr:ParA family protein [Frankia canadensis]SNQ45888.1 putative partitioning or sporulation protein [Frankia canadensis]SOU53178.1 putative partitioning or sporulation protein [Frankia canadensis]